MRILRDLVTVIKSFAQYVTGFSGKAAQGIEIQPGDLPAIIVRQGKPENHEQLIVLKLEFSLNPPKSVA